jgi:hypothetical protein
MEYMPPTSDEAASLRFGTFATAAGLVLAHTIVFPLKSLGFFPNHTWVGIALAPAAIFGLVGSLFAGRMFLGQRWWMLFVPAAFVSLATLIWLNMTRL